VRMGRISGERGIRTPGTNKRTVDFESEKNLS
jgi:hypothetical protein